MKATIGKTEGKNKSYVIQKTYAIRNGQYGIWEMKEKSFEFIPKGSAVYLKEIVNRIDTGEKLFELLFYDAQGCEVKITFPRKELTEQGIMALLAHGVQVVKQDAKALIKTIFNQEPDVPCILQHEALGFTQYDEHTVFLADTAVGVDSKYCGKLQISPRGTYEEWISLVKSDVLGNTPLEFILAVAGSGVLVDYLREKVQVENIIVSLVGESSSGKSTAGLFMVSCGAKPSFQGDSFVLNFSDTQNALLATIQSSFPVLIDEGSLCSYNPTKLLYSLSMGSEKKRLTKDLERSEPRCFSTAIAITSEKSLIGMSDENTGLLVRVIEIENVIWTKGAQSADFIKKTVSNNYGWLIPKLAEYLLDYEEQYGQEAITSVYWEWYECLVKSAKAQGIYNNLTERVCKQYALILMSASLIESTMNIELNTDEIIKFIETHSLVREANHVNIGARALIYLMQYVTKYYSQFVHEEDEDTFTPQNCRGRIKNIRRNGAIFKKRLLITDETLEKILKEGRFPDKKVILKKWKEQGILRCEKDRYISDIVITGGMAVKGYKIDLPEMNGEDNKMDICK